MDNSKHPAYASSTSEDSDSSSPGKSTDKKLLVEKQETTSDVQSKAQITEEDLNTLIQRIREIITLPVSEDVKSDIDDQLKQFVTDTNIKTVFVFLEGCSLKAQFEAPHENIDRMYFVKRDGVTNITVDNFSTSVLFGNIDKYFQKTLLSVMKYMFLCTLYRTKLPYRIKLRVTKNLELLLCHITEIFYKNFGLTVLYTPAISLFQEKPTDIQTDDLIRLYENILVRWCNQLSDVIHDNEFDYHCMKEFSPLLLVRFWQYKMDNLELVQKTIQEEHAVSMCKILEEHHSIHVKLVNELQQVLLVKMNETRLNVRFVKNLKQVSENLDSSPIENVPALITELMLRINIIISNSTYFKSEENAIVLVDSMSQQIINVCKRTIQIKNIVRGETEEQMKSIILSVLVCSVYQEIQKQLCDFSVPAIELLLTHLSSANGPNCIDLFIQRCTDLLELCSLVNIFFNVKEDADKRIKFEYYVNMADDMFLISNEFSTNLQKFQSVEESIFYFQRTDWYDYNYRFQEQMNEIKSRINDLLEKSFSFVTTVEDGLDILRIVYQYSKWPSIKSILQDKCSQLISKFVKEANEIKDFLVTEKTNLLNKNADHVRRVLAIFMKKRRLQFLFQLLHNCEWLQQNGTHQADQYKQEYKEITNEIDQFIFDEYKEWNEKTPTSFSSRLKEPLLGKCFHKPGLIEVNIDRKLLRTIREAYIWIQVGFIPTAGIGKLLNSANQILVLYGNVEELVMTYNRILTILSTDEKRLYYQIIKLCAEIINPALCTLQWDHEQSNKIVLEYLKKVKSIENVIQIYKTQNGRIIETFRLICCLNLVYMSKRRLNEIIQEFKEFRLISLRRVVMYYNQVASWIQIIFDSFSYHILKSKKAWNRYVGKIDDLLECALKCCIKNTLNTFLHNVSPSLESNSVNLQIELTAEVKNHQIIFQPQPLEIVAFCGTLKANLFEIVKLIPRLFNEFKMSKVEKKPEYAETLFSNEDIDNIQSRIIAVVQDNLKKVRSRVAFWHQYSSLWTIDVQDYVNKYIIAFDNPDPYETGFKLYTHIMNEMRSVTTVENIELFVLDTTKLASEVERQCEIRLQHLAEKLKQYLIELIENIGHHIDEQYSRLKEYDYKSEGDLDYLKNVFVESVNTELEISKMKNYIHLLEKFKFEVQQQFFNAQEELNTKWLKFVNMMDRCRLKMKTVHDIVL